MKCFWSKLLIAFVCGNLYLPPTQAEISTTIFKQNVQFAGQSTAFGELYGIHGADKRRPNSTGRIAISPTLKFGQLMTLSADMILSTEGIEKRQNMNILGLHPVWSWGRAHVGDYSDQFAAFTLNGINIKGGELDIYPKKIRFSVGGGQTRRAIEGYQLEQSFAQYLYSMRLGYGTPGKNYFDIHAIKVKDDLNSLDLNERDWTYKVVNADTLQAEADTLWIDQTFNDIAVKPQENLVLGCVTQLDIRKKINLLIEASASAYTQDLFTEKIELDSLDVPKGLRNLMGSVFTPHYSTFADYALNSNLGFDILGAKTELGYRYIGPGYISLGTPSTYNDRQELRFSTNFKWETHRIRFNYTKFSDNLLNQKTFTNSRHQLRTGVNSMMGPWRSSVQVNGLLLGNDASNDSLAYNFNTWIFTTHQSIVRKNSILQQIGLQYVFQTSNKSSWQKEVNALYNTINLTGQINISNNMNANLAVGLSMRNPESGEKFITQVYSARLAHHAFNNKMISTLYSSSSLVRDTKMLRTGVTASYRLSKTIQLNFNLSSNVFRGLRNYEELIASTRMTYRF